MSSAVFPDDIIVEILSWLTVNPLVKMKCVSKSWNTLISDPNFIKTHLSRSARHSQSYIVSYTNSNKDSEDSFIPFSISGLLENLSINLPDDTYYRLIDKDCCHVVGCCNGLVCLLGHSLTEDNGVDEMWLRIWNPATRTISNKLGYPRDDDKIYEWKSWQFTFGYVNSTDTYKVVALHPGSDMTTKVHVLSFGNNIWKNIQTIPARLLQLFSCNNNRLYAGVHLDCTINWLAINCNDNPAILFVIISLNLATETYTQFQPPPDSLEELSRTWVCSVTESRARPGVCVLKDSLCFYHDFEKTELVIWKMTKFGDENSWTQFLRFSYHSLQMNLKNGFLIFNLYENGDTLVCANHRQDLAYLYNWRNNRVVKTGVNQMICWFSVNHYVESLVPTS